MRQEILTLTQAEMKKVLVVEKILDGRMTNVEGATVLGLGVRQMIRHRPRERKPQAGMLWQIDATPYAWLEDRAPSPTLHAAIDDATGTVVGAVFRPSECREGYSLVMQQGIRKYGRPLGLYSDRHTIFRSLNEKLTVEQELAGETKPLSHFGKAMADLHIEHIKAITPQAKDLNLDHVFTIREYRKLGHGNTLSYNEIIYTFAKPCSFRFEARTTVEVRETLSGEVLVWHKGQAIPLKETEKPVRKPTTKQKKAESAQPRKPAANHPWRLAWNRKQQQENTKTTAVQVT